MRDIDPGGALDALIDAARSGDEPTDRDRDRVRDALLARIAGGAAASAIVATTTSTATATTIASTVAATFGAAATTATTGVAVTSATSATAVAAAGGATLFAKAAVAALVALGGLAVLSARVASRHDGPTARGAATAPLATPTARAARLPTIDRGENRGIREPSTRVEEPMSAPEIERPAPPAPVIEDPRTAASARAVRRRPPAAPSPRVTVDPARAAPSTLVDHGEPLAPSGVSAELALLREARSALAAQRVDEALAALDRFESRFANPMLAPEALALRVHVLCRAGQSSRARAVAEQLSRAHPSSPQNARVRHACWE